jgi:uncharacterized protein YndB with AHSA1/START domain
MTKIIRTATISAPVRQVYEYVQDPRNWPEFWPGIIVITGVQSLPNGGYSGSFMYKMVGLVFNGEGRYTTVTPNKLLVIKTKGGVRSTIEWEFTGQKGDTSLTFTVDYRVPVPLLGKLAETIIVKMNEHEADLVMRNLQVRFLITKR